MLDSKYVGKEGGWREVIVNYFDHPFFDILRI
jgi:hypothetical protein